MTIDPELSDALGDIARADTLLVATDFDGVIAPIVADPAAVRGLPDSLAALDALSREPKTHVALISGRSLEFLRSIEGVPTNAWLAGSHGSEFGHRPTAGLDLEQQHLLDLVTEDLSSLARTTEGVIVEPKSGSVAIHFRNVDPSETPSLRDTVIDGPGALPGIEMKFGKMVIELAVFTAHKGVAIQALRADSGADRVIFIGDDITDEDGFLALGPSDLGVKVGDGATAATARVADPAEVVTLLTTLLAARRADR